MEFKFKNRNEIEVGDLLKFKRTGELFPVIGSYSGENFSYFMFYGFSVPKVHMRRFFESSTTDIHVYN